jgi:hypothetical protein
MTPNRTVQEELIKRLVRNSKGRDGGGILGDANWSHYFIQISLSVIAGSIVFLL